MSVSTRHARSEAQEFYADVFGAIWWHFFVKSSLWYQKLEIEVLGIFVGILSVICKTDRCKRIESWLDDERERTEAQLEKGRKIADERGWHL